MPRSRSGGAEGAAGGTKRRRLTRRGSGKAGSGKAGAAAVEATGGGEGGDPVVLCQPTGLGWPLGEAPGAVLSSRTDPLPPMHAQAQAQASSSSSSASILPLSMQLMRPLWNVCCDVCALPPRETTARTRGGDGDGAPTWLASPTASASASASASRGGGGGLGGSGNSNGSSAEEEEEEEEASAGGRTVRRRRPASAGGGMVLRPPSSVLLAPGQNDGATIETLVRQYLAAGRLYGCQGRANAGVLTCLRFGLPTLRASGSFHDADMLALGELLLLHRNGALAHIRRLDFSIASKEGREHGKCGFRSHGAFVLSRVLRESRHIHEVYLQRNRVGPYGSSALFLAAGSNPTVRTLVMRRCQIGERGALAFAEHVCASPTTRLAKIDLSVNQIGFRGCIAIETALGRRAAAEGGGDPIEVDLEGNLVFQEVMNGVTHGMGVLVGLVGYLALSARARGLPTDHRISCKVYSFSILLLYLCSTLYHSFFALQVTRYVFEVIDKCAIYILIAGSYTPYLRIALGGQPRWSVWLLAFIWGCCLCGVSVEALFPTWKNKGTFSLSMFVGMGWACVVAVPDLLDVLPQGAINLLMLGGVAYTSGIPFFIRNVNLDHSIWHCFVLAGSVMHWLGVYLYCVPLAYSMKGMAVP